MPSLKELSAKEELLTGGHTSCPGCGYPALVRLALLTAKDPVVVGAATGCMEVNTTIFPYTAWKVPFIHSAFENSAATVSGVEAAYKSLLRQGKIKNRKIKFIAFGGDGGTYDIGLQSLSGAMERGHDLLYICYDNGAYMNTGIQRSGATPKYASTTTAPSGKVMMGKEQTRKNLTELMVAHDIPYVAQTISGNWLDFTKKVEKALSVDGPSFINVLTACPLGWGIKNELGVKITQLAAETLLWPLYEVIDSEYKINYQPKERKPITDWLKPQARFKHLFRPGNEALIEELQADVDRKWQQLLKKAGL